MFIRGDFLLGDKGNKRGQVTVFIIIALVIIASVIIYIAVKPRITAVQVPLQFQPLENYYLSCIKEIANEGALSLGAKGGWIEEPEFVRGNPLEPLSSSLNFLGSPVPYWLYVNDGGMVQQAPTKSSMEEQLGRFIANRIDGCDFRDFSAQGYSVDRRAPEEMRAEVSIGDDNIRVSVIDDAVYSKEEESSKVSRHEVALRSSIGKLYNKAIEIFNFEMKEGFLENYTLDVIRLYAPVDGVEISCAPKIWKEQDIFRDLRNALEANVQQIKLDEEGFDKGRAGSDKPDKLSKKEKYFTQKIFGDGMNAYFRYSKNWLTSFEIRGGKEGEASEGESGILIAEPVGNQEGLGILGFCYVPYHFVYNLDYPVMVQVFDSDSGTGEFFQFPMQVIIRGNRPRSSIESVYQGVENTVCKYKVKELDVYAYDSMTLDPVKAQVSFKCLNEGCYLGESNSGSLKAPQCVNGALTAKSAGYETATYQISTNNESSANIFMDRLYEVEVNLSYDDGESVGSSNTFVYFVPEDSRKSIKTIAWPEQKSIKISEGAYNISAYIYENSNITLPSSRDKKCFQVPKPGFAGIFGFTKEECYDVTIPGQKIQYSLSGGGRSSYYFTQSQLGSSDSIEIKIPRLPIPKTIEGLHTAYTLAENKKLGIILG